jgi:hypothetical protein
LGSGRNSIGRFEGMKLTGTARFTHQFVDIALRHPDFQPPVTLRIDMLRDDLADTVQG